MEKKYFVLGSGESNIMVKLFQIILGVVCIGIAIYWLIFNTKSMKINSTLWITIAFLMLFGIYQILAGSGKTIRFIEINDNKIRMKKSVLLPSTVITTEEIKKIEIHPFNLVFVLKSEKRILLRFDSSYVETNEKIKDGIASFGDVNLIETEFVEEKI